MNIVRQLLFLFTVTFLVYSCTSDDGQLNNSIIATNDSDVVAEKEESVKDSTPQILDEIDTSKSETDTIISRETTPAKDSVDTKKLYGLSGNVKSIVEVSKRYNEYSTPDDTSYSSKSYFYGEAGLEENYTYNDQDSTTYFYDSLYNLIEIKAENEGFDDYSKSFQYDGANLVEMNMISDNNLTAQATYSYSSDGSQLLEENHYSQGELTRDVIYTYGNNGRVITRVENSEYNNKPVETFFYYTYSTENGLNKEFCEYVSFTEGDTLFHTLSNDYTDDNGVLIIHENDIKKGTGGYFKYTYTYNDKNDIIEEIKETKWDDDSELKIVTTTYTYIYDQYKNWIEIVVLNGSSTIVTTRDIEYY